MRKTPPSLSMRAVRVDDAELIFAWRQEPAIKRFNPLDPISLETLRERLATAGAPLSDTTRTGYRWMIEEAGRPVATVNLAGVNRMMLSAELGYSVAEAEHGRGIATEAIRMVVDETFRETDLVKLIAYIHTHNTASWRAVERLGFTREGLLRQHFIVNGERVDEYLYGVLRQEWR